MKIILIIERLFAYFQVNTNTELAKKLEVTPTTISNWKARNTIDFDLIFTKCEGVNYNWLLTGEGKMFVDKAKPFIETTDNRKGIPLVNIEVAAGLGNPDFNIADQDVQALYVVPDFSDVDFMIRIKGNSMYPKYSSGDIIACRKIRESKFIQWNKCYVIATQEQGVLVQRIRQSEKPDSLLAVSDNKEYQPFNIPLVEITGIALIVGVIKLE